MNETVARPLELSVQLWNLFLALSLQLFTWLATSGTRIILIVILAWGLTIAIRKLSARARLLFAGGELSLERAKRADTLSSLIRTAGMTLVAVAAGMMILKEIGLEIAPILATAGIGGLAIGFGAQSLVKDVISGFFLLVEDQVRVGDVVELGGRSGLVEQIGLRTVTLRDLSGKVHIVPNGNVDVVVNMTKDFSFYPLDVGVSYREDPDEVITALRALGEEMQSDPAYAPHILAPLEIFGVDSFADSAVMIKARIKTMPAKQWNVGREFNRRMKKRFDELGIEIPFPHVTIYAGQDKKGGAPALPIALNGESRRAA